MKRMILAVMMLVMLASNLLARHDVMYVYRNDGMINALLTSDIDSICFSKLDLDSVTHREHVVQEVWTVDSVYRIPLALIDSVSLITPETVYKPGAYRITESMLDYIIGSDSLTLYFKSETPNYLLPAVNDKLTLDEVTEALPHGFLGQVYDVRREAERIVVDCNALNFSDVYARYYSFYEEEQAQNAAHRAPGEETVRRWGPVTWEPEPVEVDGSKLFYDAIRPDPFGDLSISSPTSETDKYSLKYTASAYLIVSDKLGEVFNLNIKEEVTHKHTFSGSGKITKENSVKLPIPPAQLPIPFLQFYVEIGAFVRGDASLGIEIEDNHTMCNTMIIEFCSRDLYIPHVKINHIDLPPSYNFKGMINGNIDLGLYLELGVQMMDKNLASLAMRGEIGLRLGGNAVTYKHDSERALHPTDLYESLLDTDIHLNWFCKVGDKARLLWFVWSQDCKPVTKEGTLFKVSAVPKFSNTTLKKSSNAPTSIYASTLASGYTMPVDIGFTLFEGNKEEGVAEEGKTTYALKGYKGVEEYMGVSSIYHDINPDDKFTVFPTVKLWGIEMIAEPSAEMDDLREHLIRFYESTNGDNWYCNDNWCSDKPINTWYGVDYYYDYDNQTYDYSRVQLSLSENNLSGYGNLENFTALGRLYCYGNQLTNLNLTGCTGLEIISCGWNRLTKLDVRGLTSLKLLYCGRNEDEGPSDGDSLEELNASGCTALKEIKCYFAHLTSLNVSGCTALVCLDCYRNQLTRLDVSECASLLSLYCAANPLTSLDVRGCKALEKLYCSNRQLTTLNVSGLTALIDLRCGGSQLTSLDVSGLTALKNLECTDNQLTSLDVSGCTALENLYCFYNQLTSLNLSGYTRLKDLWCYANQLTSLNVSGCTAMESLACTGNQLTTLNVSGLTSLIELSCESNKLTSLNVSGCTALRWLYCEENHFNQEIPIEFDNFYFKYDYKYKYEHNYDVWHVTENEYGWWYPGEPGSCKHER